MCDFHLVFSIYSSKGYFCDRVKTFVLKENQRKIKIQSTPTKFC